ncbi:MAG: DUF2283 domain-containing protein [Candidatus Omnitrophota bacterium]
MRISYDQEVDALYIRLLEGDHQCQCVRLTEEISINLAADETLVGIEILDARRIVGQGNLPSVELENAPIRAALR